MAQPLLLSIVYKEKSMTRYVSIALVAFVLVLLAAENSPGQGKVVELYDGLDPVELLAGQEVPGDEAFAAEHGGYRFLFRNSGNLETFKKDPARYEPANGGTCARMGPGTMAVTTLFAVHEGHIYLFGSSDCRKAFIAAPARYLPPAEGTPVVTAADWSRGRALAELVHKAIGGRALLAATSYRQVSRSQRPGPNGPALSEERTTVRWPADLRVERDLPFGTVVNAVNDLDAFSVVIRKEGAALENARPAPARIALAESLREKARLSPFSVLRAVIAPGSDVAVVRAPSGADPSLAYLQLQRAGMNVTLGVDKATGRPRSIAYRGRATDGAYAAIVLELDDYREQGDVCTRWRR
jgi:YHS domain-containing protein